MAEEFDDTGVLTNTTKDQCSVLVKIDGKEETLSFSKNALYCFGLQCEGDMTNILEDGMEVELCYRLPQSGNKPVIIAVWLGDKPDRGLLNSEEVTAVYGQQGYVDRIIDDADYLVCCDNLLSTVIARKGVVYRDGVLDSRVASVGDRIMFDALPSKSVLQSGALYQATCAWIGKPPRLVDRFGLSVSETKKSRNVKCLQANLIYGSVIVIPNDAVALVEVEVEDIMDKVILFRSSFSGKPGRIQDNVEVGERLCMSLRFVVLFRGKRQWFAAKAWKDGDEIPAEDQVCVDDQLSEMESLSLNAQSPAQSQRVSVDVDRRSVPAAGTNIDPSRMLGQPLTQRADPSASYKNRVGIEAYPGAGGVHPSWYGYNNIGAYPVPYAMPPAFPMGMVALPAGMHRYPMFVGVNPGNYAHFMPTLGYPTAPAGSSSAENNFTPSNSARIVTLPDTVSSEDIPKVLLEEPDKRGKDMPKGPLDKPDRCFSNQSKLLWNIPSLRGIIGKHRERLPGEAYISFENLIIGAQRSNIYIHGRPCTEEQYQELVSPGRNVVYFEAVLLNRKHPRRLEKKPTHDATCVWVGLRPTLVDIVSGMQQPNHSLLGLQKTFFGVVVKLYLPDIALVDLVGEEKSTVCVHVSAFGCKPRPVSECLSEKDSIINFVGLQSGLSFRIVSVAACPIVLTAVDVKLVDEEEMQRGIMESKMSPSKVKDLVSENNFSNVKNDANTDSETIFDPRPRARSPVETVINSETVSSTKNNRKPVSTTGKAPRIETECAATDSETGSKYKDTVFMVQSRPKEMRARFVNFSGTMQVEREDGLSIYKIIPLSGFPSPLLCSPKVFEFCRRFNGVFDEHDVLKVKFDAECKYSTGKVDVCIYRIWWNCTISGEKMLYTDLARDEAPLVEHNAPLRAIVTSITQHDAAVADCDFDNTSVIIPIEALRLSVEYLKRGNFLSVDRFLKKGDEVILTDIKTRSYFCKQKSTKLFYHVAGTCWKAEKLEPSLRNELNIPAVQEDASWLDIWFCGEFSRKERVVKKDGRYYVDFTSSKISDLHLSLDIFQHSKFLLNGTLQEKGISYDLENSEVKFHVAHREDPQNWENVSGEFYVKYVWIGGDPVCFDVLKDELEVPDGLVVDGRNYLAVIEDFVLPSQMICKIGVLPVVVSFPQFGQDMSESEFKVQTSIRCNSQVVIKVREVFYKGLTILESDSVLNVEKFDDNDVLIACQGEVVVLPNPEGIIKAKGTETYVNFNLCCVLPETETRMNRYERFKWFWHLRDVIKVGSTVRFSAAKTKRDCFEAYEVWLA